MSLLVASLLALAVGPLLVRMAGRTRSTLAALDGFVLIGVGGLVLVSLIPHSIGEAGLGAIAVALVGLLAPGLIERWLHRAARQAHTATLLLAFVGVTFHAFVDGVALGAPPGHDGHSVLGISVVLHRLPEAITIWWLLRPGRGAALASAVLFMVGAATLLGYANSGAVAAQLGGPWMGLFQALVAGSLLHVVFHRPPLAGAGDSTRWRVHSGFGALAGLALVAALAGSHDLHHSEAGSIGVGSAFLVLALESAPPLLLAFAIAGMVQVLLPQARLGWMRTGSPLRDSFRGVLFGLPLPICSCGVVPIYRSMVVQGVPATAAMAFLVATPELGVDSILISFPLLGPELSLVRVGCAFLVALVVGWGVGRLAERLSPPRGNAAPVAALQGSLLARLRAGLRFGFVNIVDHTGPWLLLGLAIAALMEPMLRGEWLTRIPYGLDVPLFAFIGLPVYVCASGATPFVAVLIAKGVSPGAAIAFLLTGPATNVTTFGVLAALHGRRVALAFGGAIAGMTIGLGYLVNFFMARPEGLSLRAAMEEEASILGIASLVALTAIFLLSLLRQGPRGFLGQILSPYGSEVDEDHDHDHDHGHGHDHG